VVIMGRTWAPGSRLRLRRGILVAPAGADRWQVRWDFDEITYLEGAACGRVLPWLLPALDGSRTLAELEDLARARSAIPELHSVLECLEQNCFLATQGGTLGNGIGELAASLETMLPDPAAARERVRTRQPIVCGRSTVAECIVRSLTAMEFQATTLVRSLDELLASHEAEPGDSPAAPFSDATSAALFPVVIEPDWLPQDLDCINARMLVRRRPWMLVGAWNRRVLIGPIFLPGETACYACHRRRLASHRRHLEAFEALDRWRRTQAEPLAPSPILPAVAELAAAWTALEVFHYAAGAATPRALGRVLVYHPEEARLNVEPVLRVPWCSICSSIASCASS
jgi:ribosomal protein S12 methylthiotransferase accessory factor